VKSISLLGVGVTTMNKLIIISVIATLCSGCQCFRVCPAVPAPPETIAAPALCYHLLRPTDPPNTILECYSKDIVKLEGYSKQLDKALGAYR